MLTLAALALAAAPAAAQPASPSSGVPQLLQSCEAHKFETIVRVLVDGKPEASRVKICGVVGQTDAAWLRTLKDAAAKVAADQEMQKAERDQLAGALSLEILKVQSKISSGIALPVAKKPGLIDLPTADNSLDRREYSALPPLPPPVARASSAATAPTEPPLPPLRLRVGCASVQSLGREEDCGEIGFGTTFVVHAEEAVPGGTKIRFLRDGEISAELPLQRLASGKSARIAFPRELCSRVLRASVKIDIMRSRHADGSRPQVVGSEGPLNLYCI